MTVAYPTLLAATAPQLVLVVTALLLLGVDLLYLREMEPGPRRLISVLIAGVGCLVAIGWLCALPRYENLLNGMLVLTPLRRAVQICLLSLSILTLLLSVETSSTDHVGEFTALVLFATIGMLFLVSSEDILLLFVSLELTSLCLYVLTAFNKDRADSAEAALKYFLFGGTSAAFTLFGLSFVYGLSHSTRLSEIATALHGPALDPLLIAAMVMVAVGFAFKIAAAPFHLWAPDVYQGAPLPSAAFIASGSKVAGFVVLANIMMLGFRGGEGSGGWHDFQPGWVPMLALLSAISMVIGNLAALVQTSVRRLLAYSAVAHAGYLLLAVMAADTNALSSLAYYAITYAVAVLGAFGVVSFVLARTGSDKIIAFAGLSRREPLLAYSMAIFLFSLAGIPPLAGFFGKFYVFSAALTGPRHLGLIWLVVLALALSAVSLYYYLKILKQIFVSEPAAEAASAPAVHQGVIARTVLFITALATLVLGAVPSLLLNLFKGE